MPKNIILLSDGTGNSADDVTLTNIAKLRLALRDLLASSEQIVFYDAGIGTEGNLITREISKLTGVGIKQNIIELYAALALHYELGDKLYLIGFSRGATTVRSLACMIRKVGILRAQYVTDDLIEQAYNLYNSRTIDVDAAEVVEFRKNYSYFDKDEENPAVVHDVAIAFLGVYDTVEALGFPGLSGLRNVWFGFHDLRLSRMVKVARHALALDEHRKDFAPTLWIPHRTTNSEQRWFPGVHSDIGGGYQHHELADTAYIWMMAEAQKFGLILPTDFLAVDRTPYYVSDNEPSDDEGAKKSKIERQLKIHPNYLGKLHDSRFFMRSNHVRVPGMTRQYNPPPPKFDECIDETVLQRKGDVRKCYNPTYFSIPDESVYGGRKRGRDAAMEKISELESPPAKTPNTDPVEKFFRFRT